MPFDCCNHSTTGLTRPASVPADTPAQDTAGGVSRKEFLRVLGGAALGLSTVAGGRAFAAAQADPESQVVTGGTDRMIVDRRAREVRISCDVTKDASKPGVVDWGKRGQAWFGVYGGAATAFFIFTTALDRAPIDQALRDLGLRSRNQLGPDQRKRATGLKPATTAADYLDGDPVLVTVRFEKDGQIVEAALEDLIEEKLQVEGKDVVKPYTPHWVYHGTGESLQYASGCVVCPSDCFGGLITDNTMPLLTYSSEYRVNWERMPPVGSKVEVVLKSIFGPSPLSAVRG